MEIFGRNIWDQAMTYCHYNLHDTSLFNDLFIRLENNNNDIKNISFANYCENHKINLLAAAPLSMGLLTHQEPPIWHPASTSLQKACKVAAAICLKYDNVDLSTLALVFAISNPQISCTILGMKNIEQIKMAQVLSNRVNNIKLQDNPSHDEILKLIFTYNEWNAFSEINDTVNGPFAELWKNGDYKWDGIKEVDSFWQKVQSVEIEKWQNR